MIDELFDRQYQAGRDELHANIDTAGRRMRAFADGLKHLHRMQFAAPWAKKNARFG